MTSASGWDIKNFNWDAENVQNLGADAKSVTISFTDTTNAGNVYVKVTDKAGNEKPHHFLTIKSSTLIRLHQL